MTMPPSERRRRSEEHLTDAELNELVDGALSATDTERASTHLATCPACDERYRTLLATVSALRSAPSVMPRRSFQLTPEQAKIPAKAPSWLDRFAEWIVPGVPAIRAATLAVALLLLSVTAIDVLTHRNDTTENAGPAVMRQAEPAQQRTSVPAPRATDAGLTSANQPESASGGAAPTEESGPMVSGAVQSNDAAEAESTGAADLAESDTSGEVPPAPAAMPPEEPAQTLGEAPESMIGGAPEATPAETATPSPVPPSPTAAPSPTPAEQTSGSGTSISRWRIAEFGLLLLLVWLGVTWFGRTRVGNEPPPDDSDTSS